MRRALALLGGIALAVMFSQYPEYAQQYEQRLGGAVDELRVVTERFDADAAAGGLTREQALATYRASDEEFLSRQGRSMAETFMRYSELSATLRRISGASPIERFNLMPQFFDTDIGGRTLDNFKPAVPVTTEGFVYAGVGLFVGYALVWALVAFVTLPFRRRRVRYRPTV